MRSSAVGLVLLVAAVMIFTLSNTDTVTVRFWQWPLFTGSLALAVVGAGVLGALLTFAGSLARHAHLSGRIRSLEQQLHAHGSPTSAASGPAPSPPSPGAGAGGVDDTRRLF